MSDFNARREFIVRSAIRTLNNNEAAHAYDVLPLRTAIDQYVQTGHPIGGFLSALLSNDLVEAVARADDTNIWLLPTYASYLYNHVPRESWGTPEKVEAWLAAHSERRQRERDAVLAFHEPREGDADA